MFLYSRVGGQCSIVGKKPLEPDTVEAPKGRKSTDLIIELLVPGMYLKYCRSLLHMCGREGGREEVNVSYSLELGRITAQEAFLNILRV